MSIPVALLTMFGKPLADRLFNGLRAKKDGAQKLEQASAAMASGLTAVDALKKVFGKEFFAVLNDAVGTARNSSFSYEAGTGAYITLDRAEDPAENWLKDELNINLDRLTVLEVNANDRRNHFRGLMSVWQSRVRQRYTHEVGGDIDQTFAAINSILDGKVRNFRQIYELVSRTGIGGVGALMLISGVLIATGTGVGIVSAIFMFIFGIPWLTVGILVLPGALLVLLAARKSRPNDDLSLAVGLAYKLLERLGDKKQRLLR